MAVTPQMRTQVTQLYVSLFGRAPEADGLGYWVQQLSNGKSLQTVAQDMYNVAPSRIYYPLSLSNEEIVGRFYSNVLGRQADAGGLSYWTGRLNTESTTGTAASRAIAVGTVVTEMLNAVVSYSGTDAVALASQSLLNNKVAVGLNYAFTNNGNDVAAAASLIPLVTAGPNGQAAANTQIDKIFNDAPTITSAGASSVAENAATSTVIYTAVASDADLNDTKTFSLKAGDDSALLNIDAATGAVTLKDSANFEAKTSYSFTVVVTDKFGATAEKAVIASVTNVNEAPVVTSGLIAAAIAENGAAGAVVYTATATDVDANTVLTYSLSGADAAMFSIDATTGAVYIKAAANFEAKSSYSFSVTATDNGSPALATTKAVTLAVTNANEAPVVTSGETATIAENAAVGTILYTATASDVDAGDTQTYSLKAGVGDASMLSIDSNTGAVTLLASANFEAKSSYSFTVVASDASGFKAEKAVIATVTNVNEAPVVTSSATATIAENAAVSTVLYTAAASDVDAGDAHTYSLKAGGDAAMLSINAATGEVTLLASANFEAKASYSFTVVVTDAAGLKAEKAVVATVSNVNEAPVITSAAMAAAIAENGAAGAVVYTAAATDVDAGTVLTYSLSGVDASMFFIDAMTGAVTINAAANFESKASYAFNVTATDNGSPAIATTKAVTLAVTNVNEAPMLTSGATAMIAENAAVGTVVYTAAASDVDAADTHTYSLKAGGDAAMLAIDAATGVVTLVASADFEAKASYSFTVVVTDAAGLKAEKLVTANVGNVNEAPVITSGATATIEENAAVNTVLYTAIATDVDAGDTQTYSLKAGVGDAALLVINPTTGAVTLAASADFEAKASYSFTVVATDAAGLKAEKAVVATVTNANEMPVITSAAVAATIAENGAAGAVVYTAAATDVDAGTVFTYSLSGADAAMFSINPATGAVSINAAANFEAKASYAFSVTATDNGSPVMAATKAVTLTVSNVNEAPVANVATGTGFENTVITGSVIGTDVDAGDVLTYALVPGSATNGTVTINATTGAYTFTPNANYFGPATFQYTVTDRDGLVSAAATVTLTVNDVANILTAGLDNVTLVNPGTELVIGTNNNLNAGDVISGGANDKVVLGLDSALVNANFAGFNLGVGTFQVTNDSSSDAVQFDMSSSNGVNTLVSTNSSNDIRFNFANTVADTDADGFDEVNLNVLNLTAGVSATLDIRNADALGNDELNLLVTNSEDNSIAAASINLTAEGTGPVNQTTASGIETVNLSTAGSLSAVRINDLNTPGSTVLNISTAKTLVIGDSTPGLATIENALSAAVTTVNATGSTGDIALSTVSSVAGATVTGGSGNDTFYTSDFADVVVAGAGNDTVNAGNGDNSVDGGDGNDAITTGTGNDTIAGGAGNNVIAAGDGANVITAADGNNNVTSGTGIDNITLGNGNNVVVSGAGVDTISVGNGVNNITAGDGNDTVTAGNGGNVINAGAGNDSVTSGDGNDSIDAAAGDDYVSSGAGNDTIKSGDGFDTIIAGAGNDVINMSGASEFDASGSGIGLDRILDSISGGDGTDELQIRAGSVDNNFRNVSSVETLTLMTAGTTVLQGGTFVPAVPGPLFTNYAQTAGIQTINALNAGNDVVNASTFTSNLTVNLGGGDDNVATGSGSDTFNVASFTDADTLNAGAGVDVLNLDADTTLTVASNFSGFETINLGSGRNNTVADSHQYNIAVDNDNAPNPNPGVPATGVLTINGADLKVAADLNGDTDTLDANEGAETLVFNGAAVSAYNLNVIGGDANDTITGGMLSSTIASGAGDDTINTTGGSNLVTAGAGNDTINFGVATDNVNAGEGNDTLNVGGNLTATDTINGGDGTDTITTNTGYGDAVYANVSSVEVLTLTSGVTSTLALNAQAAGIRTINGDASNDIIDASAYTTGNLTINGNGGNDNIKSGAGADVITTGAGEDTIESGAGSDRVMSGSGSDNIKLGAGNDAASFTGSQLDATDIIDGGADTDAVELNNATAAVTAAVSLTNVKNIESFKLTSSGDVTPAVTDVNANTLTFSAGDAGSITMVNVDASALTDSDDSFKVTLAAGTNANYQFNITGSSTSDTFEKLNVGANNNVQFDAGAGSDSVIITGGDMGANITVLGGAGNDSLVQNGGVFIDDDMQNVFSVETLTAKVGTVVNAVLGSQVDANMGLQSIVGSAGNDNVLLDAAFGAVTTALNVNLAAGGNDTINAGATNVAVNFVAGASNITALDVLSGGKTANDVFTLTADNGTADLSTTTNVETINVVQLDDNNIGLTLTDNTFTGVAANRITVNAATLDGTNNLTAPIGGLTVNAGGITKALTINAGAGNDNLTTGSGDDTINLGAGNDTVDAGNGNNVITNNTGDKRVTTGSGTDSITLGDGNNWISSGAGNDTVSSGNGNNTISGGDGNDNVTAGNGNNMIDGGTGTDNIVAGNGNNTIAGGTGNDTIVAGTGSNVVDGGDGNDRITVNGGALTSSTITGGQGADTITGSAGADTFRYVQLTDSDGNGITPNRDAIVGFDTTKDKVAIEAAMFGNNTTLLSFAGNGADFADAQGAVQLGANNGKADFVYQADTGRLWVDLNDDGILNGADLQINFRNADGSIPSSMVFAATNVITQDTIAPTAPTLDLLPASDSNVNTDNVTNVSPATVRVILSNTGPGTAPIAGDFITLKNGAVSLPAVQLTAGDITLGYKDIAVALNANSANSLTAVISNDPAVAIQGPASATSAALVVTHDNVLPTAVLVDTTSPALISTDARMVQTYQVTFSEPVTGFALTDLTITGGGVASGLVAVSSTVYTFSVTVPDNSNTAIGVSVNASAVIDLAGNNSTASNTTSHTVDTTNPTLTITDGVVGTANIATGAITYTFTFSEGVSGFDATDVTVTNGTKGLFTGAPGSSVYTLVVTPTAGFEGNLTVAVAGSAAIDANGNNSVAATDNVQVVDTLRPTITIATPIAGDGLINANEDNTVTIAGSATGATGQTVNVSVTDGASTVTGTATVLANGTWSSTTMDVSALNNGTLTFTATVADAAANTASPAGTATATLDNVGPTATIFSNRHYTLFDGENDVTYTIDFNEPVTGFTVGDLAVGGGTIGTFTAVSATRYTVTVTAFDNSVADVTLSFAAGSAFDLAGNGNAVLTSAAAQTVDTVNPTYVSFVDDQAAYANIADGVVTYTVVFSEPVANFTIGDLTVTGGTAGNFAGAGTTWTFDVTAPLSSITPISVTIAAGALTDVIPNQVGNVTLVSGTPTGNPQLVDRTAPVVVINDFDGVDGFLNATEDNTLVITGTATDTGSGVEGRTITVTVSDGVGGAADLVGTATVTGGAWSVNFGNQSATWANNAALTVTATVSDVANNPSTAATGTTSTINDKLVAPFTVADIAGDNQLNLAEKNLGVTVTGAVEAGSTVTVDVAGVTRSALVTGTTFSYSLTPTDYFNLGQSAVAGDKVFTINATDVAGNTAQIVKNVTVDTVAPVTPSITNFSTDTGVIGDNITTDTTLVLTGFAEPNSTVTLYNDTLALGTVTANGAGAWTFTTDTNILAGNAAFTPGSTNLADGARLMKDGQYLFNVTSTDTVGNVSAPSATQQVLVDTGITAPAISGFTVNTGATNETGVDAANAIITKDNTLLVTGTAGSAEGGATVYVYSVAAGPVYTLMGQTVADATGAYTFATGLLADGTYQFAASQRDLANNDSVTVLGASGYSAVKFVTVDTAAPVAPVFNASAVTLADNGDSTSDEITNDPTITLNGTVTADATSAQTVNVYSDAGLTTLVGTVVVAAGATAWTLAVPALAQNSYTYYATSTDAAANVSVSSLALPVVIDLTVPTSTAVVVSDTSNASTATPFGVGDVPNAITSSGNFTITAADLGGSGLSATAAVNVAIAGPTSMPATNYANVVAAQAAIDAFMDAREAAFNDGTYTITVIANDVAGNAGVASTASLVLDTTAPTTPTIALTTDSGAADLISNNVSISVTAGGVDTNATQTQYSINAGATWLTAAQYATATTADGAYSVTARVVDAAGNVSATSNTLAVTKDNTAPVVTLALTSDTGTSALDNYTNQGNLNGLSSEAGTVSFTGVMPGGVPFNSIAFANMATALAAFDGFINGQEAVNNDGAWSVIFSVTDGAGNIGTATKTFTLDTVAGLITANFASDTFNGTPGTGTNADFITSNGLMNIVGLEAGATWIWDTDGNLTPANAGTGTTLTLPANTTIAIGNFQLQQTDLAGNVSATNSSTTVLTTDSTAPAALTMPTAVDLAGADSTLSGAEVTGFVLENFTGSAAEAGARINYTISDADPLTADITGSMAAVTWDGAGANINLSSLSNGNITITANQVDVAGNVGATASRTVTMNKNLVTITAATYDNALNTLTLTGDFGVAGLANGVIPTSGAGSINFSKLSWEHNDAGTTLDFASLIVGGTAATLAGGNVLTIQLDANAADAIETNGAYLDGIADVINIDSDFIFGGVAGSTSSFGAGVTGIGYAFQGGLAAEVILGDTGNDTLNGGNGADTINGGAGNDSIIGGNGADNMTGGAGADIFNVSASRYDNLDVIQDFNNTLVTGDKLNLGITPWQASGALSVAGPLADITAAAAVVSSGTSAANLLADLQAAVAAQRAGAFGTSSWAHAGDTIIVQITGASVAGTNVYYVIQNTAADATFDGASDVVVALVGTSTVPTDYANFLF